MLNYIRNLLSDKSWAEKIELIEIAIIMVFVISQFILNLFQLSFKVETTIMINTGVIVILCQTLYCKMGRVEKSLNVLKSGYIYDIVHGVLREKSSFKRLRLYSFDGDGFFNALIGSEFQCETIELIIHSQDLQNEEKILSKWIELKKEKNIQNLIIKKTSLDSIVFGMILDNHLGAIGLFKPQYHFNNSNIASTLKTYKITDRNLLNDFSMWFDTIFKELEEIQ